MDISRRNFLMGGAAVLAASVGVSLHAHDLATRTVLSRVSIELERWPRELDGFELVQLSDIHFGTFTTEEYLSDIVEQVNALKPKLIVITGDFVTKLSDSKRSALAAEPCGQVLKKLIAPLGVYCVLGNHDALTDPVTVTGALRASGQLVLDNQSVGLEQDGRRFWLLGGGCFTRGNTKLWECVRGVPREEPRILLVHEPDFADHTERYVIDLQLSGHSHGGQVRFPIVGALYLPPLGRKYPMGLYKLPTHQLYTNVGVGSIGVPMRLGCPPEISLITLRSKPQD